MQVRESPGGSKCMALAQCPQYFSMLRNRLSVRVVPRNHEYHHFQVVLKYEFQSCLELTESENLGWIQPSGHGQTAM